MKKKKIEELKKYTNLLQNKNISKIVSEHIPNSRIRKIYQENNAIFVEFSTVYNDAKKIELKIENNVVTITKHYETTIEKIVISNSNLVKITKFELYKDGLIIRKINKYYNSIINKTKELTDLVEKSYLFSSNRLKNIFENVNIKNLEELSNKFEPICYDYALETQSTGHTIFVIHRNEDKNSLYETTTCMEGIDLSHYFDVVKGKNVIDRIYNLYNGIITPKNEKDIKAINLGLLSKKSFDLKEVQGIKSYENFIVGNPYPINQKYYLSYLTNLFQKQYGYYHEIKLDRNSILDAIKYIPKSSKNLHKTKNDTNNKHILKKTNDR